MPLTDQRRHELGCGGIPRSGSVGSGPMKIDGNLTRDRIEFESRREYWPQTLLCDYLDKWTNHYPDRIALGKRPDPTRARDP